MTRFGAPQRQLLANVPDRHAHSSAGTVENFALVSARRVRLQLVRASQRGTPLAAVFSMMSILRSLESYVEALLRIVIGSGLMWIGVMEGRGSGAFLDGVGAIFIAAGLIEAWLTISEARRLPPRGSDGVA